MASISEQRLKEMEAEMNRYVQLFRKIFRNRYVLADTSIVTMQIFSFFNSLPSPPSKPKPLLSTGRRLPKNTVYSLPSLLLLSSDWVSGHNQLIIQFCHNVDRGRTFRNVMLHASVGFALIQWYSAVSLGTPENSAIQKLSIIIIITETL